MSLPWLFHLSTDGILSDPYSPPSLTTEGFIHCSFIDSVRDTAARYFPTASTVYVHRIDPNVLVSAGIYIHLADTPRGPMPHIHGAIARAAIVDTVPLSDFLASLAIQ